MLDAAVAIRLGDLALDVSLVAREGEVVVLLGPNGAGKSTIVRLLAGLLPADDGRIVLDGITLDDAATDTFVPTDQRRVGVVFQDYLLFPRMSACDNVAFGLRARGADRHTARARALVWLDRFGLTDHANQRPDQLSGGQAQRVALARALATEPRLLLLDEPLAALDATTRLRVRSELRRHLASFDVACVLVTHDPVDALVLGDRLVIIESGRITQTGTPAEITSHPATPYVADLVGINFLPGNLDGTTVHLDAGGELSTAPADPPPDGPVAIAVRPQAVALYLERPHGSPRNTWQTTIVGLEADRSHIRANLGPPIPLAAEITADAASDLALRPGTQVWATVKAVDIAVYRR